MPAFREESEGERFYAVIPNRPFLYEFKKLLGKGDLKFTFKSS